MDANHIVEKAKKSISGYCMEECKAFCCRKGYLVLSKEEAVLVTDNNIAELERKEIIKKIKDGRYSLFMGDYAQPCPRLKDFKCSIHKNPERPDACKRFPLYLDGMNIMSSNRCPAVREGLFYPYIAALIRMGYRLNHSDPFFDLELYNFKPDVKS